jgi:hypothetical protein
MLSTSCARGVRSATLPDISRFRGEPPVVARGAVLAAEPHEDCTVRMFSGRATRRMDSRRLPAAVALRQVCEGFRQARSEHRATGHLQKFRYTQPPRCGFQSVHEQVDDFGWHDRIFRDSATDGSVGITSQMAQHRRSCVRAPRGDVASKGCGILKVDHAWRHIEI